MRMVHLNLVLMLMLMDIGSNVLGNDFGIMLRAYFLRYGEK